MMSPLAQSPERFRGRSPGPRPMTGAGPEAVISLPSLRYWLTNVSGPVIETNSKRLRSIVTAAA